jgi:hypothetical protein
MENGFKTVTDLSPDQPSGCDEGTPPWSVHRGQRINRLLSGVPSGPRFSWCWVPLLYCGLPVAGQSTIGVFRISLAEPTVFQRKVTTID